VHIIGGDNNAICSVSANRYIGLLHLLLALTMHVYILPSTFINEGQLVGSRADHFSISCMKLHAELCPLTTHKMVNGEKLSGGCELGAGKLAEGMEVYIVDAEYDKIDKI
jgi:hypothetical protein